jgi:hypothetical protein
MRKASKCAPKVEHYLYKGGIYCWKSYIHAMMRNYIHEEEPEESGDDVIHPLSCSSFLMLKKFRR